MASTYTGASRCSTTATFTSGGGEAGAALGSPPQPAISDSTTRNEPGRASVCIRALFRERSLGGSDRFGSRRGSDIVEKIRTAGGQGGERSARSHLRRTGRGQRRRTSSRAHRAADRGSSEIEAQRELHAVRVSVLAVERAARAVQVLDAGPGSVAELPDEVGEPVIDFLGAGRGRPAREIALGPAVAERAAVLLAPVVLVGAHQPEDADRLEIAARIGRGGRAAAIAADAVAVGGLHDGVVLGPGR